MRLTQMFLKIQLSETFNSFSSIIQGGRGGGGRGAGFVLFYLLFFPKIFSGFVLYIFINREQDHAQQKQTRAEEIIYTKLVFA